MNTTDLLDAALTSRFDAASQPNSQTWRASSAGYCQRGSYLERLGVKKTRIMPVKEKRTLEWGNQVHDFVKGLLRDTGCLVEPPEPMNLCPGCRPDEWHIEDTELNASAHLDTLLTPIPALVRDGDARMAALRYQVLRLDSGVSEGSPWVCEIKGIKSSSMMHAVKEMQQGKFGAPEHHLLQLGTQALILRNNPKAVPIQPERFELLHAGKDAFGYLSWDLTDAWISRAEEWLRSLNDFWKAGTLPPCTCSGWKRLYCSFPEYQGEKVIGCCDPALAAAA